jgi:hypothetical protein
MDVATTEPVPGLHVYEIPAGVSPDSPYRWILAHHAGAALASFETAEAATRAAESVGPLADWSRNAMTTANQVSFGGNTERLMELLTEHGGQHPNA